MKVYVEETKTMYDTKTDRICIVLDDEDEQNLFIDRIIRSKDGITCKIIIPPLPEQYPNEDSI